MAENLSQKLYEYFVEVITNVSVLGTVSSDLQDADLHKTNYEPVGKTALTIRIGDAFATPGIDGNNTVVEYNGRVIVQLMLHAMPSKKTSHSPDLFVASREIVTREFKQLVKAILSDETLGGRQCNAQTGQVKHGRVSLAGDIFAASEFEVMFDQYGTANS